MKPEVQHISITQENGVAIMLFVTNDYAGVVREATDEAIEAEIKKSQIPMVSWRRIKPEDIPKDRTFRNAWRDQDGISIDMSAAREIHRNRMRKVRTPLLEALDVAYMRADESADESEKDSIASQKQALRDVTEHPDIEAAETPEALKEVWPEILN